MTPENKKSPGGAALTPKGAGLPADAAPAGPGAAAAAIPPPGNGSAPGQAAVPAAGRPLRLAIFGNPVAHSLSPLMHAAAYRAMGIAANYEAIRADSAAEVVRTIRERGLDGASVTLPFKESLLPLLDDVDETSRRIGAVNTVIQRGGRLSGRNTDAPGLALDLLAWCGIRGRSFVVLGAGGAARAALVALLDHGGRVIVINRSPARARSLAEAFGCAWAPWAALAETGADVLINTTPLGMFPETDQTPLAAELLPRFGGVLDTIYNPLTTRLLQEAAAAGCRTRSGVGMFVAQGAGQIRLWTDREPPLELMRQAVRERLGGNDETN
jgi:shikimate dehydrogenase